MKTRITRRTFLEQTGVGAACLAAGGGAAGVLAEAVMPGDIPAHRGLVLRGLHAYADQESVQAGQPLQLHVSSDVPWTTQVVRLGMDVDDPASDEVIATLPAMGPVLQSIHPGSYVHVAKGLAGEISSLTLELWVRPWKWLHRGGLFTQYDAPDRCLFGLFLEAKGVVGFHLGPGSALRPEDVLLTPPGTWKEQQWLHLVATWDGETQSLFANGVRVASRKHAIRITALEGAIRIGAAGRGGVAQEFADADIAGPAIYSSVMDGETVAKRTAAKGLERPASWTLIAHWPFSEERGSRVKDVGRGQRHGEIVNEATWMIGGPSFNADVPRFGGYYPGTDGSRGHALRFASDDLYDCRWRSVQTVEIPRGARPGIYAARMRYEFGGKPVLYHVTFVVRRSGGRKRAPILVMASTNTWRAYSGTPFGVAGAELHAVFGTGGVVNGVGDPPAYNFYRTHAAGQGTFQIGLRMPWPSAGPYVLYGGRTRYSHLCRADRFFQSWLERSGYEFDVISDTDLHRNPALLKQYKVFVINGHSEYWSMPMYHGLESYLNGGGRVVCLSGNTLFWRVSFDPELRVIECRKVDAPGEQLPHERRGECWHSHDGLKGGLLRECGFPGWKLVGLETLGWNNQDDPQQFGAYRVEAPDHFLFQTPVPVGLAKGDLIGQGPDGGLPRANGHEIDVRLSTLARLQQQPNPEGASMPEDPAGITPLANGIIPWERGGAAFDYFFRGVKPPVPQGGEMVYWERPSGGRVFHAGSIGAGWAIASDPAFQRLIRNVLHHYGVPEPRA